MSNKEQSKQERDKQEFFEKFDPLINWFEEGEVDMELEEVIWQWIESKKVQWQREAIGQAIDMCEDRISRVYNRDRNEVSNASLTAYTTIRTDLIKLTSPTNQDE